MAASSSSIDPSNELAKQSEYAMQSFEHIETTLLPEEQVELDLYKVYASSSVDNFHYLTISLLLTTKYLKSFREATCMCCAVHE